MPRLIPKTGGLPSVTVEPNAAGIIGLFSSTFGQLAAKFQQKARDLNILKARREGAIAGTEGPVEIRKGLKAKDLAFNDAANQTSMNRLQVKIREKLLEFEQENPINGQRFNELASEWVGGAVAQMRKQDELLGSALASRAASFQTSASLRIREASLGNAREGVDAVITEGEVMNLSVMRQDFPSLFSGDPVAIAKAIDSILESYFAMEALWAMPDPGGEGTHLSADEIVRRRISTIRGIYVEAISGFIRQHDNPGELEDSLNAGTFTMPFLGVNVLGEPVDGADLTFNPKSDLPPDDFNRLVALARAEQGRRNQDTAGEAELDRSTAIRKFDASIAGFRGPEFASSIQFTEEDALLMTRGNEVEAQILMAEWRNEQEIASLMPLAKAESVADAQARIKDIKVTGENAPEELRRRKVFEQVLTRKIAALREDPFEYARSGEFGMEATDVFENGGMDELTYRTLMRDLQIATATGLRGFVPSVLSNDEALGFVSAFNQIEEFQDMIDGVSGLQQRFGTGRMLEFAVDDLEKAGLPPATSQLVGLDSRQHENRVLARALTVGLSDLQKRLPEGVEKKDILREITTRFSEWERALPFGNDDLIQGKFDAMILLATGLIVFDQYSDRRLFVGRRAESKAVSVAYEALIGSKWPSIVNNTLIIAEQDNEQIHAAAGPRGYARAIERVRDDIDPALADKSKTARFQYIEELLNSGRFVPDENDEGFQLVDSEGRPVLSLKTGEQLTIPFSELFNIGESVIVDELALVSSAVPLESRGAIRAEILEAREDVREEIGRQEETVQVKAILRTLDPETGSVVKFLQSRGISLEGKSRLDIVREVKRIQDADRKE